MNDARDFKWFRWHRGTCEDGKFKMAAKLAGVTLRDIIAVWALMLEDASRAEHRGVCCRKDMEIWALLDFEDRGTAGCILDVMRQVGLINPVKTGWAITNWDKRQFTTDRDPTAADRQRKKRARDKGVTEVDRHGSVTGDSHGSVTPMSPPDTDTDTDTDSEKTLLRDFEEWYGVYPRKKGKGAAETKYKAARKHTDHRTLLAGAQRQVFEQQQRGDPQFTPYPATWLHQKRWLDEETKVVPFKTTREQLEREEAKRIKAGCI